MEDDLQDRTIVITGGSSGVGAAAARIFAGEGARVVVTGRSDETDRVAQEVGADPYRVDFNSLSEVDAFADALLDRYPEIHVLVNNAGAIIGERQVTPDGNELTLQVNHLAGFHLTNRLRPRLEASTGVVINTSSATNTRGRIDFDDLQSEEDYSGLNVYATSKLMNILHAREVNRRFDGVHAVSFHPGAVATGVARDAGGVIGWLYESFLGRLLMISPEKGADTLVWLVRGTPGEDWTPGGYYAKRKPARTASQVDGEVAQRLWEASEELIAQSMDEG